MTLLNRSQICWNTPPLTRIFARIGIRDVHTDNTNTNTKSTKAKPVFNSNSKMGKSSKQKKRPPLPPPSSLILPPYPYSSIYPNGAQPQPGVRATIGNRDQFIPKGVGIVDTHCHLLSTLATYLSKYPPGSSFANSNTPPSSDQVQQPQPQPQVDDLPSLLRTFYFPAGVDKTVNIWCEPSDIRHWREVGDMAIKEAKEEQNKIGSGSEGESKEVGGKIGGVEYRFAMGIHPHNAKEYTDEIEAEILEAMNHPLCVAWGEIGLDYHYDNSPREIQEPVLRRQLGHAIRLGKPIVIHTREADDDIYRILTEVVPKEWKIHVHCFTDSLDVATKLLDWFPNLYIGITGVITYTSNQNTSLVARHLLSRSPSAPRILLETDSPYMTPMGLPTVTEMGFQPGQRCPLSHSGMIPWTAEFLRGILEQERKSWTEGNDGPIGNFEGDRTKDLEWTVEDILNVGKENARKMYGF